jgi:hypothetical protein
MGDERSHEYLASQQSMYPEYYQPGEYDYDDYEYNHDPQTPISRHLVPPPESEEVDEKTWLRTAEERLLPSRPPDDSTPSSSQDVPTAPVLDYDSTYDTYAVYENTSTLPLAAVASAPSINTIVPSNDHDPPPSPSDQHPLRDDKQELERQRLIMEASAPNMEDENAGAANVPTAPVLTEEDEYSHLTDHNMDGSLPRYQR